MKTYLRGLVGMTIVFLALWVAFATKNPLLGVAVFGTGFAGAIYTGKRWGF